MRVDVAADETLHVGAVGKDRSMTRWIVGWVSSATDASTTQPMYAMPICVEECTYDSLVQENNRLSAQICELHLQLEKRGGHSVPVGIHSGKSKRQ